MYRIVICDDEIEICEKIKHIVANQFDTLEESVDIKTFSSGEQLIEYAQKSDYTLDLLFLDIELIEMNGVEVGRKIRQELENESIHIVYVSGKKQYHEELFEMRPLGFISKPIKVEDINNKINYALKLSGKLKSMFEYTLNGEAYRIPIKDIMYFQSYKRKVQVVCKNREEDFYGKLSEVYLQVEKCDFVYTHKSFIVNMNNIHKICSKNVIMLNNHEIPISRAKLNEFRQKTIKLFKEKRKK